MTIFERSRHIVKIVENPITSFYPNELSINGILTSYINPDSNIIEIPTAMLHLLHPSNYTRQIYSLLQEPINNNNKIISHIKIANYTICYKTFPSIEKEILIFGNTSSALRKVLFKDTLYYTNLGNIYTEDFTPLIFSTVKLKASNTENMVEFVERPFYVHPIVFTEDNTMTRFIRNKYIKELVNVKVCSLKRFGTSFGNSMPVTISIKDIKDKFISFIDEPKINGLGGNALNADIQSCLSNILNNNVFAF